MTVTSYEDTDVPPWYFQTVIYLFIYFIKPLTFQLSNLIYGNGDVLITW